ncbi:MAG: oxidoreductase [Planctomycetaceae bacterium]|nr:oxidoreductase [Planctomycetaceae bacterium]
MTNRKVALVTGSGKKRVGNHVAAALAARGYALVIHYRTSATEAAETAEQFTRAHGVPVQTIRADIANEAEVKAMVTETLAQFGRLDVLVNCAAIWDRKRLEDVTADDVRRHFDINTLGTFLTCQHAGLAMAAQPDGGCIVNIGDWADARPYRDYAAYFPSKAAIPGLTRTFAVELGTRNPNVRVNAVLPGPVMLPPDMSDEERAEVVDATLVKREGSPEHIVKAVLHFIDNDFISGACLPVDGGRSVYAAGH